ATSQDRLTIIGEGHERQRLEQLARDLEISGQVNLPGYVLDPLAWIAAADALILSSNYEGLPATVIEALAVGTPIVATDCSPGISELLDDGGLGIIVRARDEKALAAA